MDWPRWTGYLLLVAVPALIWFIVGIASRRIWKRWAFFAIIAGSDNRLSLSRLQAFVWTLIVFGAYAAALAVTDINADDATEANTESPTGAESEGDIDWIEIPDTILALTGISLASGVISSVIASVTDEQKRARITEVTVEGSTASPPAIMVIRGVDFDGEGTVRIGRRQLKTEWIDRSKERETDATQLDEIRATLPPDLVPGPLIVDTAHGKLVHMLDGALPNVTLGEETTAYEWVDLFRNDKSPRGLDLMKFQMFGWTLVSASAYVVLFVMQLHDLGDEIASLPKLDETIVILTGISQAAYNAAKGTAAINPES